MPYSVWRIRRLAKQNGEISPNFATQNLAEREGFEPSVPLFERYTRFPVALLQPARTSLRESRLWRDYNWLMAFSL